MHWHPVLHVGNCDGVTGADRNVDVRNTVHNSLIYGLVPNLLLVMMFIFCCFLLSLFCRPINY